MAHFEIQDLTFTYPTAGGRPSLTDVSLPSRRGVRGALRQKRKWKDYAAAALENGTDASGEAQWTGPFAGSRWGR